MNYLSKCLFLLGLCTFFTTEGISQWEMIPSGTSANLYEVHFPNDTLGYTIGDNGTVLLTSNKGLRWNNLNFPDSVHLNSVYFINSDTGFVGGDGLYRTFNRGKDWEEIFPDTFPVHEIYFSNDSVGYTGSFRSVFRTDNYGQNWSEAIKAEGRQNGFNAIHFPTENTGYFIGGTSADQTLYRTLDNGKSFQEISNGFISIKESVYFLSQDTGYMCGWYNGLIVRTEDGGQSWYYPADEWANQCKDIYFLNENEGYYIDNSGGRYGIYHTSDRAKSWQQQLALNDGYLNALAIIDDKTAVAVGFDGMIYRTTNGGMVSSSYTNQQHYLTVYPNPAKEFIKIELPETDLNNLQLDFISLTGITHLCIPINNVSKSIPLLNLASGVYILHLHQNQRTLGRQKLIIE